MICTTHMVLDFFYKIREDEIIMWNERDRREIENVVLIGRRERKRSLEIN